MIIGSHVRMKAPRYVLGSIEEALSYEATACMLYTGAPQNSKRIPLEKMRIEEARKLMEENGMQPENIIVHAPYIINLGNSIKTETSFFGRDFLVQELERAEAIGARIVVLHPGAHMKAGCDIGIDWIVEGLNDVFTRYQGPVQIALETMAGKGSEVGASFEEIAYIRSKSAFPDKLKVCLDTCHIHDAGYDLSEPEKVLEDFDEIIGLDNLAVIHFNDSKNPRGARKDRHENLGQGHIGFETMMRFISQAALKDIPVILETPYIDDKPPYKEEIQQIRAWLEEHSCE